VDAKLARKVHRTQLEKGGGDMPPCAKVATAKEGSKVATTYAIPLVGEHHVAVKVISPALARVQLDGIIKSSCEVDRMGGDLSKCGVPKTIALKQVEYCETTNAIHAVVSSPFADIPIVAKAVTSTDKKADVREQQISECFCQCYEGTSATKEPCNHSTAQASCGSECPTCSTDIVVAWDEMNDPLSPSDIPGCTCTDHTQCPPSRPNCNTFEGYCTSATPQPPGPNPNPDDDGGFAKDSTMACRLLDPTATASAAYGACYEGAVSGAAERVLMSKLAAGDAVLTATPEGAPGGGCACMHNFFPAPHSRARGVS